jgi:lipopolysaccharide export system permease protein
MSNYNQKKIFDNFLKDNLYFFILSALSIALIIWIVQAVNYLEIVAKDGHSFKLYFYNIAFNFPKIFSRIMPLLFFTSLFYTIIKYENNNELKIFWINGLKKIYFINALIKYTFIFFFINIFLVSYLNPLLQNLNKSYLDNSNLDFFPSLLQEKKFIDSVKGITLFIDRSNSKNVYGNIFLKDETRDQTRIIFSKKGKLFDNSNKRSIKFYQGEYLSINKNKTSNFNFDEIDFDLTKYLKREKDLERIQEIKTNFLFKCLRDFNNLGTTFVEYPNCNKAFIPELKDELYQRVFKPFHFFLITIIVGFLLLSQNEDKRFKKIKYTVFVFGFLLVLISEMSVTFFSNNLFTFYFLLIFPFVFFSLAYLTLNEMLKK